MLIDHFWKIKTFSPFTLHHPGKVLTSVRSVNGFLMVVYEKMFLIVF